jgi:tol-pal system beta propeller repeat protein TolB
MKARWVFVVALLLIIFPNTARAEQSFASRLTGKIVFQSNRDSADRNTYNIYVMNADGTNRLRLTDKGDNWFPSFSPDGTRIAFVSNRDGKRDIYLINPDGTNLVRLTTDVGASYQPAWSPDGKHLAFTTHYGKNQEIFVIDADGNNLVNLSSNESGDERPTWSPDGKFIAFASGRDYSDDSVMDQIYVMAADGSKQERLTDFNSQATFPSWAPNGQHIAFSLFGAKAGLYVMQPDGTNATRVAPDLFGLMATWAPDSQYIAMVVPGSGKPYTAPKAKKPEKALTSQIHVVDVANNTWIKLTDDNFDNMYPSWAR